MSQKPPTEPTPGDDPKSMIVHARAEGRAHATEADGKPLAIVAICQAYFRMVAQMAIQTGNPDEALDQLLDIHRASARLELQSLREAGL